MTIRVTFLVPYPVGRSPGQRFRFEQWLRLLPEGAVHADIRPLWTEHEYDALYRPGRQSRKAVATARGGLGRLGDIAVSRSSDVTFIYREAFPLGPPLIERLVARRTPVVYDFDDAIWLGDTSPANAAVRSLKAPGKVDRITAAASVTTVGNEYLATRARESSPRVEVLPTTIDVESYYPPPRSPRSRMVRVGWSGSPTTSAHLRTIAPALRRLTRELPVDLVVMGDPDVRLPGVDRVHVVAWDERRERDEVGAFDIGLMPLPDDEWTRGKCGFKALLYMALGVATVASPVGVNTTIIQHGRNGLLADGDDEWFDAVASLVDDHSQRVALAEAGRATVVERWSGQRWAPRFLEVLERAAAS